MAETSNRIKLLRNEKGLSQKGLGEILNIPRGTIAAWETGDRTPELAAVSKLSDYFRVTMDYLLGRSNIHGSVYSAIEDDTDLVDYIEKLAQRDDLKVLAKKVKDLDCDDIMQLTEVINKEFPMSKTLRG